MANIVYGSASHSVDTVLIGGEVVLRHKQLTSLDEQELRRGVEVISRHVLGEIGIAPESLFGRPTDILRGRPEPRQAGPELQLTLLIFQTPTAAATATIAVAPNRAG